MFWKIFHRPNDVLSLSLFVFKVPKLFGFLPFTVNINNRHKSVYITPWNCLTILIAISMYCFCIYAVYLQNNFNLPYSRIQVIIVDGACMFSGIVAIFSIFMDYINRHHIWRIIKTFYDFDNEVCVIRIQFIRIVLRFHSSSNFLFQLFVVLCFLLFF